MASAIDIAEILAVIAVAYPNFTVTEKTNEIYWQILSDIPTDELKAATLHCISESGRKFAPSVGELRGAVGELRGMTSNVPSSYQAWNEFRHIVVTGNYRLGKCAREDEAQFSHPLVEKAAKLIGLRAYGQSDVSDEMSWRARFIQCYEQLQERAERENLLVPEVRGYIETNGGRFLAPSDKMKLLAGRMSK